MIFALSAAIAAFGGVFLCMFGFAASNNTAPPVTGLFWLALAVLFGIRRPGGALLAGFAFAAGTAVFHWLASDILPGGDVNALVTSHLLRARSSPASVPSTSPRNPTASSPSPATRNSPNAAPRNATPRIAAAEAETHDGLVPAHEQIHETAPPATERSEPRSPATPSCCAPSWPATATSKSSTASTSASNAGKVVALLGANGAGKSTLCSVAAGLVEPTLGTVTLDGTDVTTASAHVRARDGMLLVPEARGIFPGLTVEENLTVLLRTDELRDKAFARFPILSQRRKQDAGLLSGGEQQMLSLAPALADPPVVLIADEPTLGLAPLAAEEVMRAILELRDAGSAVLLVEEHAQNALEVADTLAFMELGTIVWSGPRAEADMEILSAAYLGGSVGA